MSDWHCQQTPNGNNPIVECERGVLLDAVATLTRRIAVLEAALEPFAVFYRGIANLDALENGHFLPFPDAPFAIFPPKTAPKLAYEALEANDD